MESAGGFSQVVSLDVACLVVGVRCEGGEPPRGSSIEPCSPRQCRGDQTALVACRLPNMLTEFLRS